MTGLLRNSARAAGWGFALGLLAVVVIADEGAAAERRVHDGLLVLYDFESTDGDVVRDRSGVGTPLDLRIMDPRAVRRQAGLLEIRAATLVRSSGPAQKINDAVRRSNELTIEAWLQPAKTNQSGPARIVTLSKHSTERNFTLGQDGEQFDIRLRTTRASTNGIPSVSTRKGTLKKKLTHVVYTREQSGQVRIYLDGKSVATGRAGGSMANWNGQFQFAFGDELNGSRSWLGSYRLVAVYGRALSLVEVQQNFEAGSEVTVTPEVLAMRKRKKAETFFHRKIAPILARNCLECHDAASRKGGLDLSRRASAFAGSESGRVIRPGDAKGSFLRERVDSDDMPKDRDPLSTQEKQLLAEWIESGAVWPDGVIDPAVYELGDEASEIWVQRLTIPEYIETVRSTLGVDIADDAREVLPADLRADGFSNTAYNLSVDLKHVSAYATLAERIVKKLDTVKFAGRFAKSRLLTDKSMYDLIEKMGKWILRGPLDEHEVVVYRGISTTVASAGGDFREAVGFVIEAMLQSPRFIYRIETQRKGAGPVSVGSYELASRLSYILWGGPPDEELMRLADAGTLADSEMLGRQVNRMLRDRRAAKRSLRFFSEWLDLDRLDSLRPNARRFPDWSEQLASDMRTETLAFVEEVVWKQQRSMSDLLNAQVTFVSPRLAKHYGVSIRGQTQKDSGRPLRIDLSSRPERGGLLTQGSILTVGGDEASMVSRGLFVLHDLLRGRVKDPPPCVDTSPVATKAGLTQRAIAEARIADANCGGCHARFEPLAFGLEKFDGIGAFHQRDEHGNQLRDDGEIFIPGSAETVAYSSSAELMDVLAGSERVRECLAWKVAQFALGRPLGAADAPVMAGAFQQATDDGFTYSALVRAIVMSDLVRMSFAGQMATER